MKRRRKKQLSISLDPCCKASSFKYMIWSPAISVCFSLISEAQNYPDRSIWHPPVSWSFAFLVLSPEISVENAGEIGYSSHDRVLVIGDKSVPALAKYVPAVGKGAMWVSCEVNYIKARKSPLPVKCT